MRVKGIITSHLVLLTVSLLIVPAWLIVYSMHKVKTK